MWCEYVKRPCKSLPANGIQHTFCVRARQVLKLRFATAHASEVAEKRTSNRINRMERWIYGRINPLEIWFIICCRYASGEYHRHRLYYNIIIFSAICVAQYDTMQVKWCAKWLIWKLVRTQHTQTGGKGRRKAYSVFALMRCANKSISNGFSSKQFFFLVERLFIHFDVYVSVDPQDRVILFIYV